MRLRAYTVYDNKALSYSAPFFQNTDAAAVRIFKDMANDSNTTIGRHPGDYVLYMVGEYDDQNGQLWPQQPLTHVADASALLTLAPIPLFDRKEA